MPNVKNTAYYGNTGTLKIDGDTHLGVTSFTITPTTVEESVADIGGDVQALTGATTRRAQIVFHQDHKTTDSISKLSESLSGQAVSFEYTPAAGGDGRSGSFIMKPAVFGGGTGRHEATLDLAIVGTPTVVTPAGS